MSGMAQGHKYTKTYEAEQNIELEVVVWIPELVACWSEVGGSLGISEFAIVAWSEGTHIGDCALDLELVSELAG